MRRYATRPISRRLVRFFSGNEETFDFGNYSVILPEEPFVWGVSHIRPRSVPTTIRRPSYATEENIEKHTLHACRSRSSGKNDDEDSRIQLGSEAESKLRASAKLARKVRAFSGTLVRPGVATNVIDAAIHDFILAHASTTSPRTAYQTSGSCSVPYVSVALTGISRLLEDGDIINIDVTVYLDGYHGDTSATHLVGSVDQPGRDLVSMTNAALQAGIHACGPGRPFNAIGRAIHDLIRNTPYSVCNALWGHGIGSVFHQPPWIHHTLNEEPGVMEPGHCFTIEPCIIQGSDPKIWIFPDGWTASTENCARSAQAEHMVLITETGAEVLTL